MNSTAVKDAHMDSDSPDEEPVSVVLYALFVPILVVMGQSAWVVQGWSFRNALIGHVFEPVILGGLGIIAAISFFVIRPFACQPRNRRLAFVACAVGSTILVEVLLPGLAE